MSLISKQDLIRVAGLSRFGFLGGPIASAVMGLTKLNKVNKLYDDIKHHQGTAFFFFFFKEYSSENLKPNSYSKKRLNHKQEYIPDTKCYQSNSKS